jgi:hypothetical protein
MKIILSRKGFDSKNGGCPSPIMPDDTLLSLPIPEDDACIKYSELQYGGHTYKEIIEGLMPGNNFENCHLDPDIRDGIRKEPVDGWKPAFGQRDGALGYLRNAGVTVGDLFLFFGLFRKAENFNGSIRFIPGEKPAHIVFGYMEIGAILDKPEDIAKYNWHPHATNKHYNQKRNALYLPSEKSSLCPSGCGILSYRQDRVLTKPGKSPATWEKHKFLMPHSIIGNRQNSSKDDDGLYYAGIWQEIVLNPNKEAEKWAKKLIEP